MRSLQEARTREDGGDASQPTTVGGYLSVTGCAMLGNLGLAPVSALDKSAECFTICTSRRARRLNFAREASPDLYLLSSALFVPILQLQPPSFSVVRNHTLFEAAISVYRVHSFFRALLRRPFNDPNTIPETSIQQTHRNQTS